MMRKHCSRPTMVLRVAASSIPSQAPSTLRRGTSVLVKCTTIWSGLSWNLHALPYWRGLWKTKRSPVSSHPLHRRRRSVQRWLKTNSRDQLQIRRMALRMLKHVHLHSNHSRSHWQVVVAALRMAKSPCSSMPRPLGSQESQSLSLTPTTTARKGRAPALAVQAFAAAEVEKSLRTKQAAGGEESPGSLSTGQLLRACCMLGTTLKNPR
mmetsp:Transcript_20172/g.47017  ORF Transcript_20172/g.47017 Transcript_20172/m.47017 type:complete len:209 (+) Transcript_20172:145-771(+)